MRRAPETISAGSGPNGPIRPTIVRSVAATTRRSKEAMRITRIKARNIHEGDQVVVTVARVMGVQGRKPKSGSPLMKLEYEDGTTETIREDDSIQVIRP